MRRTKPIAGKTTQVARPRTFPSPMPTPAYMRIAPVYDGCRRYRYGPSTTSCWSATTWRLRVKCAPSVRIAHQRRATPISPTAHPNTGQSHSFPGRAAAGTCFARSTPRTSPAICHTSSCQYVGSDHRRFLSPRNRRFSTSERSDRSAEHEQSRNKVVECERIRHDESELRTRIVPLRRRFASGERDLGCAGVSLEVLGLGDLRWHRIVE